MSIEDGKGRRRRVTLVRLAMLLVAVIVALVVAEYAARALGLGDPVLYYDSAWGGLRPLPDQQRKRIGGANVTIDRHGYRSTGIPDEPRIDLLCLGDSVTWGGSRVDDRQTFCEIAAAALRRRGVRVYAMNAGVNGTGCRNHADLFFGLGSPPDAVVWLFPWGDTVRAFAAQGHLWPPRYRPKWALVEVGDHLIRTQWLTRFRHSASRKPGFRVPQPPVGYERFFDEELRQRRAKNVAAVSGLLVEAEKSSLPVLVGITPYRTRGGLEALDSEARRALARWSDLGAEIIDLHTVIESSPAPTADLYFDDVHFSPAGHEVIGRAVGKRLLELVPAGPAETPRP